MITYEAIEQKLESVLPGLLNGARSVLLVVPDTTRTAPIRQIVPRVLQTLAKRDIHAGIIVALGTHPPLPHEAILRHVGLTEAQCSASDRRIRIMNHEWDNPEALITLGALGADEVEELTGGLIARDVSITVHRAVLEYDRALAIGPVFPHEIVGYSGGAKYLFPGISGPEMIDLTHWLEALQSNLKTIGCVDTPVRRVLHAAARLIADRVSAMCLVVAEDRIEHVALGPLEAAFREAATHSARLHIRRKPRQYRKVLSCCPRMYDDFWTGGKCVYKCEPVVEAGGELIVFAPHITHFSHTHQREIERLGYHVLDYFLAKAAEYRNASPTVMSHCALVRGAGAYRDGVENARIRIVLASQIPERECLAAGLQYVDPAMIDPAQWRDREDEGVLLVERAGEMLYLPEAVATS